MLNFSKIIRGLVTPTEVFFLIIFHVDGQGNVLYFYLKKLENLPECIEFFYAKVNLFSILKYYKIINDYYKIVFIVGEEI